VKTLRIFALFFTVITLSSGAAFTDDHTTWYGNGTAKEFYIGRVEGVSPADELAYLATLVNAGTQTFSGRTITLMADIDLSSFASGEGWTPIGSFTATNNNKPFRGIFDGNGYAIKKLTINRATANQGLFGYVFTGGVIRNLALVDVNVDGRGQYVGGVAARLFDATAENIFVTGNISSNNTFVGGIAGYINNGGLIKNSYSLVTIATTSTTSNSNIGGIAGSIYSGEVRNCYAMGTVTGGTSQVGGIVGYLYAGGKINNCAALNEYTIVTSTNAGRITTNPATGAGLSGNFAWDCMVRKTNSSDNGTRFSDGNASSVYGEGKSDDDIRDSETWSGFLSGENDPWKIEYNSPPILRVFLENDNIEQIESYPDYLVSVPLVVAPEQEWYYSRSAEDKAKNAYRIGTAAELAFFASLVNSGKTFSGQTVYLTADIDLSLNLIEPELEKYTIKWTGTAATIPYDGGGWIPIGMTGSRFQGKFDGDGHVIRNLYINRPTGPSGSYQGLFGPTTTIGTSIKNLGVVDASITAGNARAGILAGTARDVENCFTTGNVSGTVAGGIAAGASGTISNSYSTANVESLGSIANNESCSGVGGVIGCNNVNGDFVNLYTTGTIRGDGGVMGYLGWEPTTAKGLVALNPSVSGNYRIAWLDRYDKTLEHNYAWEEMFVNGHKITNAAHNNVTISGNSRYVNGKDLSADETWSGAVWGEDYANYPANCETCAWIIEPGKLPILKVFEDKNSEREGVSVQDGAIPTHITKKFTVTLHENGGTGASLTDYTYGTGATLPTDYTRANHAFKGWYDNDELTGSPVEEISATEYGDKVFWAKWTPESYTVKLNGDGGTGTSLTEYTYGTGATLPTDYEKEHHTFDGWYDNVGLTGSPVTEISNTESGDKEFWAKWTADSYTVTLHENDGVVGTPLTEYTYGTGATLPTDYEKEHHTFGGWYDNDELSGDPVTEISVTATGAKVFWAKWELKKYTVTFSGSALPSQTISHGGTVALPSAQTRDGYTFGNWYKESDYATLWNFGTEAVTGPTTIYAKWTPVTYTITYNLDGGAVSPDNPGSYDIEKSITLKNPTKDGFTFAGWTGSNGTTPQTSVSIASGSTGAKSYTANWTKANAVLVSGRVVPNAKPDEEATVIAPIGQLSGEFTAGPNPVAKSAGIVGFFRQGKRVENAELRVYDVAGNVVGKVQISDNALGNQARRKVGSWDLRDKSGRLVSEGTYLVKGVLKTSDGKSEKVSVILSVW